MAKRFLADKFATWYTDQISQQPDGDVNVYAVDVKTMLSVMRRIHNWIIGLYDCFQNNTEIHKKGFQLGGIDEPFDPDFDVEPEDPFENERWQGTKEMVISRFLTCSIFRQILLIHL